MSSPLLAVVASVVLIAVAAVLLLGALLGGARDEGWRLSRERVSTR